MTTKSHKATGKIVTNAETRKPFAEVKNVNEKTET
jgi:hypothetical protein